MNAHVQSQLQSPFQNQMPSQQQNMGQPRQGQQPNQMPMQQKGTQGAQGSQNQQNAYTSYDPQLALWTLEKVKNADTWEDVEPEQQHVRLQDLQNELTKFRRSGVSVKKALKEVKSSNARRILNDLVAEQNEKLWKVNRSLQWTIGSVEVEWKSVNRRLRQLSRIDVILETEPSGFVEPVRPKAGNSGNNSGNNNFGFQDPVQARQGNGIVQEPQFRNQGMNAGQGNGQNARTNQQQGPSMGQDRFFDQQPMRVQQQQQQQGPQGPPPPPPPPNGGQSHVPGGGMPGPPPPPPPPPNGASRPQQQHQQPINLSQPAIKVMPGAYPESHQGGRHSQPRIIPIQDPPRRILKDQKLNKNKNKNHDYSSESSSSEWDSEDDSSSTDSMGVRAVHDDFGGRGRSRNSSRLRRNDRSLSRQRSLSRGHTKVTKPYKEKLSHKRSRSFSRSRFGPPPMGTFSGNSSKNNSPRSSGGALPAQVHIHINKDGEPNTRDYDRARGREKNKDAYRKSEKSHTSQPMSRGTSIGSDTGSYQGSMYSVADDSVFSSPEHSRPNSEAGTQVPLRSRNYPRPQERDFRQPHPSQIYDIDRRPRPRYPANDYPHQPRTYDNYQDDPSWSRRPAMPNRRNSVQVTNPFDYRYAPQRQNFNEPPPHLSEPRYITDKQPSGLDLDDLADALEHIKQSRRQPLRRSNTVNNRVPFMDAEEWDDLRYAGARPGMRTSAYGNRYGYQ